MTSGVVELEKVTKAYPGGVVAVEDHERDGVGRHGLELAWAAMIVQFKC